MWTNETTINKQNFLFLNKKTLNYVLLTIAVGIIGIICGVFLVILKPSFWLIIAGFSALCLGGLYGLIVVFKSQKKVIGTKLNYIFNQDNFVVTTSNGSSTINYTSLTNIAQNKDTLLLFISKNQAYVVDKLSLDSTCLEHINLKFLEKNYQDLT